MDLDFLLTNMNANEDEIKQAIQDVIAIESEDGFYLTTRRSFRAASCGLPTVSDKFEGYIWPYEGQNPN